MTRNHRELVDGLERPELDGGWQGGVPGKRTLTQSLAPRGRIDRAAAGDGARADARSQVATAQGGSGHGLPAELMARLERALGTSLDGVRVHTGGASQAASRGLGARAYAIGQDIHFGAGEYAPDGERGQHLIAHEVAHTVQQRGGAPDVDTKLEISEPGDAHEREADRFADAFVVGDEAAVAARPGAGVGPSSISRKDGKTEVKGDKEVEVDLGGKKIKVNLSSPEASFEIEAKKIPEEGGEVSKTFPVALCPGVFGYLAVGAQAGVTISGKATVKGTASGPKDDPSWSFSVGGSGSIKGEVKATVSLGLGAGCPGLLALRGEVAAIPSATLEAGPSITGTVAYSKGGPATAALDMDVKVTAELATEFAMRVLYDVFWKKHPTEMGKFTIAKWVIATGAFGGKASYGKAGWQASQIKPNITWGPQPDAAQTAGVPIGEHLSEHKKFSGPGGDGGGSGAPGVGPDEVDDNGDWVEPDDRALPDDGGGHGVAGPESDNGECVDPNAETPASPPPQDECRVPDESEPPASEPEVCE